MLQSVHRPDGDSVQLEYDALDRRTAKIYKEEITRYLWDGNVLLHEWKYSLKFRPKLTIDDSGSLKYDREEPITNLITWVYDNKRFSPTAKIVADKTYSIINDYLGTPIQMYDENGTLVWECELDIYGKAKIKHGNLTDVPFRWQGQGR